MPRGMGTKFVPGHRCFCATAKVLKVASSRDWLNRHLKDPYVKRAQKDNYRARSAYKLVEVQERWGLVRRGQAVVECGAAPGAWTQVLADLLGGDGCIVSCDLLDIEPVAGAITLPYTDFTKPESQQRILEKLGGRKIDLVLSDMSPNLSGQKCSDHEEICRLVYAVIRFALQNSAQDAQLLAKMFDGPNTPKMVTDLERFYRKVSHVKPASSRKESSELYLLAQGFKGIQKQ